MAISRARVKKLLAEGDRLGTTHAKGIALEEASAYVFGKVPGVTLHQRRVRDVFGVNETDLIFINRGTQSGIEVLEFALIVECKNLSRPVGYDSVQAFSGLLEAKGARSGVLIASNGLTGRPGHDGYHALEMALARDRRIVVLTRKDLEVLSTTDQLVELVTLRFMDLVVYGTFRPP